MRISCIALVLTAGLGLMSCSRDHARGNEPAARRVGRETYSASQDIKQGVKKAAKELRKAGKEFREGWSERRREEKDEPPPERRR